MRAKSMVLILIALGCGLVASIAISQVMERGGNSGNTAETVKIYVATNDIDMNDQLNADNVRVEDWPKSKVPEGALTDFEQIDNRYTRVRFYEGEPILDAKIAAELAGPAIKIPEGYRVCSMKVQMDTAVSGLVNPGDRVDIFGHFRQSCDVPKTGTRELLRNVRVFAVNSETEQETAPDGRVIAAKTVSVLVKKEQVARLMLATELGTLRLALRRPNDLDEDNADETATIESLFGERSQSADEAFSNAPAGDSGQVSSAAGGFMKLLNGLKNGPSVNMEPSFGTMPVAVAPQSTGPAWEMVLLTPDGGTNYTWDDERQLPQIGSGASLMDPGYANPSPTFSSGNPFDPNISGQGADDTTQSPPTEESTVPEDSKTNGEYSGSSDD